MVQAADGWLAINLPRESDWDLVPALTLGAVRVGDEEALDAWALGQPADYIAEQAALLGIALGVVPDLRAIERQRDSRPRPAPFTVEGLPPASTRPRSLNSLTVMDLSRLWAGPLSGALLASAGAHVIKVESHTQPEQVLESDRAFARRLNGDKELLRLDFADGSALQGSVDQADIVIFSARERALRTLGLRPRPGQLWIGITAHGGGADSLQRVGFGDDAAAAAGAVGWLGAAPVFAGDALADPVTGLLAAVASLGMVVVGRTGTVRLTLAGSARWAVGGPPYHPVNRGGQPSDAAAA